MSFRKWLGRRMPTNELAFRVARKVVNLHQGDNEIDIRTNGELRVMRTVLPHASVVFDVGANVGDWTTLALQIAPEAQIHCFEPSAPTYAVLAGRDLPANVRRNHFGLGSESADRTLFVYAAGSGANSLHLRAGTGYTQDEREHVTVRTLDDYCAAEGITEIDFVKVDVEGHELFVFRGAERTLTTGHIGVMQFEYGGAYIDARALLKDIWDFVSSMKAGYSFFKIFPDGPRHIPEYLQTLETFQYSNWLIARADWVPRLSAKRS